MQCRICRGSNLKKIFNHRVLNKYDVDYFICNNCGLMQTGHPFWLSEAYSSSINISDTGYVSRNINLARKTWIIFIYLFGKNGTFLDYAGGYGLFTRLMRDCGLNFFTSDKYTKNLFARGFDYGENIGNVSAISCFEGFEHFEDPISEINDILKISRNLFFSTTIFNENKVPDKDWWYYGFEHGQHISIYSFKTLSYIAKENNLFLYSNKKNIHIFLEKKINNFVFIFLMKLGFLPWDIFYRFFIKSRTWTDYENIKKIK